MRPDKHGLHLLTILSTLNTDGAHIAHTARCQRQVLECDKKLNEMSELNSSEQAGRHYFYFGPDIGFYFIIFPGLYLTLLCLALLILSISRPFIWIRSVLIPILALCVHHQATHAAISQHNIKLQWLPMWISVGGCAEYPAAFIAVHPHPHTEHKYTHLTQYNTLVCL